jgi:hypothetical protein
MIGRMTIENALASVAVKDLKAAAAWYEKLFRRPADLTPMPEVAEWKFARGGWLRVYQIPERAGRQLVHARREGYRSGWQPPRLC